MLNLSDCVQTEFEFSSQSGIFLLYFKQPELQHLFHWLRHRFELEYLDNSHFWAHRQTFLFLKDIVERLPPAMVVTEK